MLEFPFGQTDFGFSFVTSIYFHIYARQDGWAEQCASVRALCVYV